MLFRDEQLFTLLDLSSGGINHFPIVERRLSDLKGSFLNETAFQDALEVQDTVVYTVCSVEVEPEAGQLNYALGKIYPGKIGDEYYLTKGHFHAWRAAAEVYLGLSGNGMMLLEDQERENARMVPLQPDTVVYVPGFTAHRTVNIGQEPLVYIGIYPAQAGHDYSSIASQNFRYVIIDRHGQPVMLERKLALP